MEQVDLLMVAIYVIGEWIVLNFIYPHESHYLQQLIPSTSGKVQASENNDFVYSINVY